MGRGSLFCVQQLSSHLSWMHPLWALGSDLSTTSAKGNKKSVLTWTDSCLCVREGQRQRSPCLLQNHWDRTLLVRGQAAKASHPAGSAAWTQIQLFFPLTGGARRGVSKEQTPGSKGWSALASSTRTDPNNNYKSSSAPGHALSW